MLVESPSVGEHRLVYKNMSNRLHVVETNPCCAPAAAQQRQARLSRMLGAGSLVKRMRSTSCMMYFLQRRVCLPRYLV